jgi:dTDP-4-amino-4,6-dideoxygalactose transaminase
MAFATRLGDPSSSHHLAVALAADATAREEIRGRLAERRIQTSVHYPPIHRFSAYQDLEPARALPRTDDAASRALTLPLFAGMTEDQLALVVDALLDR